MKKVSVTALPELAAVKVEAGSSCEPGQKATPPPELAAVKQEVDIEEHDLLQHPRVQAVMQTVSVLDTLFATDRQGNLLTLLESNVSTRTVGPPIISGSNINTEPDLISVKVCRVKTEKELILNKSKIIVKVVLEDCAQELRRSGRFCAKCQVLFPNRSGFISHGTVHESIYAPADVTDSSEGNSTPQALNASDAIQKYDESAKSSSAANCSLRCGHCDYSCVAAETLLRHSGLHVPARRHECTLDPDSSNDLLVPMAAGAPEHVEEIYIEQAMDFAFDEDSGEDVLSKVDVKMERIEPESDGVHAAVDATDIPNSRMLLFDNVPALDEIPADEPSDEQVLEMFTSIMFCKNQFDVDGNNAEVLVLSPAEMRARRSVLQKEASYAEARYKCEGCLRGYEDSRALEEHRAVNHVPREGERQCRVCACWVPRGVFALHAGRHRALFRCRVCGYCDHEPLALLRHLRHHTRHRSQNYCRICNINFKYATGLSLHKDKVHGGNKLYACEKCPKTFKCLLYYKTHLRRNHERSIQECKICRKTFKTPRYFKNHVRSHESSGKESGEASSRDSDEAYCIECDETFKSRVIYFEHLKLSVKHCDSSQLRYECDHCKKRFRLRSTLKKHVVARHLPTIGNFCNVCNKFIRKEQLRAHVAHAHEGVPRVKD